MHVSQSCSGNPYFLGVTDDHQVPIVFNNLDVHDEKNDLLSFFTIFYDTENLNQKVSGDSRFQFYRGTADLVSLEYLPVPVGLS